MLGHSNGCVGSVVSSVAEGSLGAMTTDPDAEMAMIMEDTSLNLIERMRRRQDLMNKRVLAAQLHEDEEAENKV